MSSKVLVSPTRNLALVLVLLLAACGGGEADAVTNPVGAGGADVDAPSANTSTLPSDFPIPAPANPVNMITAIPGTLTVDYEESRFNEVLQFYVDWMSEQEEAYSEPPADVSAGGLWVSLASEGEPGFGRSVTIGRGIGSDNRVGVVLGAPNG